MAELIGVGISIKHQNKVNINPANLCINDITPKNILV